MVGIPNNPFKFDENEDYMKFMGPHATQQAIISAITLCWHSLPKEKRTVYNLETEFMRIATRAFKDIQEDSDSFGFK